MTAARRERDESSLRNEDVFDHLCLNLVDAHLFELGVSGKDKRFRSIMNGTNLLGEQYGLARSCGQLPSKSRSEGAEVVGSGHT
jgi:hypothetical protein